MEEKEENKEHGTSNSDGVPPNPLPISLSSAMTPLWDKKNDDASSEHVPANTTTIYPSRPSSNNTIFSSGTLHKKKWLRKILGGRLNHLRGTGEEDYLWLHYTQCKEYPRLCHFPGCMDAHKTMIHYFSCISNLGGSENDEPCEICDNVKHTKFANESDEVIRLIELFIKARKQSVVPKEGEEAEQYINDGDVYHLDEHCANVYIHLLNFWIRARRKEDYENESDYEEDGEKDPWLIVRKELSYMSMVRLLDSREEEGEEKDVLAERMDGKRKKIDYFFEENYALLELPDRRSIKKSKLIKNDREGEEDWRENNIITVNEISKRFENKLNDRQAEFVSLCFQEVLINSLSKLGEGKIAPNGGVLITLSDLKTRLCNGDFSLLSSFATGEEMNVSYVLEDDDD